MRWKDRSSHIHLVETNLVTAIQEAHLPIDICPQACIRPGLDGC